MRVAVVSAGPRERVDAEAADRLDWLAGALDRRGHDVTRLGPAWWADRSAANEHDSGQFRALTVEADPPPRRLAARLPAALRAAAPDVVHASHADPLAVSAAAAAATGLRIPLVVDWYDLQPEEGWRERVRRLAVRAPALTVAPSRLVQTGLRELGRSAPGVRVIPTPVDMAAVRAAEPEPLADVVYSRRLDAAANLENLLLSLAEFRELDWEAAVIGDGPARAAYEAQASDLRIADRVHFLGEQPLERRLALFRGAHVYVHTAHEAPFAADFLRALACGCVGIAEYHAASAAHELIEHRDRGLRVTDEEELVDAIREATELERLTIDDSFAGFDVEPVLDRYLRAYRDLGVGT
ncbi:MAG: glycosyltransferase [Halobacteriales archaeon]|nr:glycosyltransferase [Halobacteriales archaeon]